MNSFFRAHMSGKQSAQRCELKSTIEFATITYIFRSTPSSVVFFRARRLLNATCPSVPTTHRKINKSPLSSSSLVYGVQKHSHIHNTLAVRRRGWREVFVRSTKRRDNMCWEVRCAHIWCCLARGREFCCSRKIWVAVFNTPWYAWPDGVRAWWPKAVWWWIRLEKYESQTTARRWTGGGGRENDREQRLSKYLFMSDTDGVASLSSPASIFKAWKCPAGRHNSTSRLVVEQLLANEKPMCVLMGGGLGVADGVDEASVPSQAYAQYQYSVFLPFTL